MWLVCSGPVVGGSQLHRGGGVANGCAVCDGVAGNAVHAVWLEVEWELVVGDRGALGCINFHLDTAALYNMVCPLGLTSSRGCEGVDDDRRQSPAERRVAMCEPLKLPGFIAAESSAGVKIVNYRCTVGGLAQFAAHSWIICQRER